MRLKELTSYLDSVVPLSLQEEYDNSGLQVGDPDSDVSSALIALDVTEDVVGEAEENGCDLIISHHPLIFYALKSITGRNSTERIITEAIRKEIAIYSAHTNLDIVNGGVSMKMAEKIGLKKLRVLSPLKGILLKLVTYVPASHLDEVREAVFKSGAGVIGNYDRCGYTLKGTGSFRAGENTAPFSGVRGQMHYEEEIRFETIFISHNRGRVIKALLESHPYEEVAYDIFKLENDNADFGLGCIGELDVPVTPDGLLKILNNRFAARGVRYSGTDRTMISRIAVCGGSGSSLMEKAVSSGAEAFITSDIKYHSFHDADKRIFLIDIGHYESEKFATEILYDLIIKKFPKFAVRFSKINTNPINYLQ